jgi:hypothetical protein
LNIASNVPTKVAAPRAESLNASILSFSSLKRSGKAISALAPPPERFQDLVDAFLDQLRMVAAAPPLGSAGRSWRINHRADHKFADLDRHQTLITCIRA